jgi:hypothetical protein
MNPPNTPRPLEHTGETQDLGEPGVVERRRDALELTGAGREITPGQQEAVPLVGAEVYTASIRDQGAQRGMKWAGVSRAPRARARSGTRSLRRVAGRARGGFDVMARRVRV